MILEIILAVALVSVITIIIVDNQKLRGKNYTMSMVMFETFLKNQQLEKDLNVLDKMEPIDTTDGFVKFLSQSREWAYEYIDNVQGTFGEFDIEMSSQLAKDSLDSEDIKKLSMAYLALKQSIMPENDEMPNN
jgi:hypothetical protein